MDIEGFSSPGSAKYLAEIIPQLYISDYSTAKSAEALMAKDIKVIVNLVSHKCIHDHNASFFYENYKIADSTGQDLVSIIEDIMLTIDTHIKLGRKVVVHCSKGISRAPSVIIAYLIKIQHMQFDTAFALVKQKSPRIDPNAGFMMQLSLLVWLIKFYVSMP